MKKQIVLVSFVDLDENGIAGKQTYSYFTRLNLDKYNWVVVVPRNNKPKVAQVIALENELSKAQKQEANKWIAQKIDLTEYNLILEREAKITAIEDALDDAFIKASRFEMYKNMAESDSTIKELLEALQDLNNETKLIN